MENKLMLVEEVAHRLSLSKPAIYALVYRRQIPFLKIGRRLRFDPKAVEAWLEGQTMTVDGQGKSD